MIFSLLAITFVSAAAVGVVYRVTSGPIAAAKAENSQTSLRQVLPPFDNRPAENVRTVVVDGAEAKVYTATSGDTVCGYAVETLSRKGFGGEVVLMVGFKPDGEIVDIEVLGHKETQGLGDKIERGKSDFSVQFRGKNPATFHLSVRKDGGDVDAITASTISSRAYADAVNRAYLALKQVSNE
ncbi:MAG: RnfABCDGE type electron transport complex subunit G [Rikenellaceae bacterium]|jgi:electron transport complex protein RnfG|nr:RnfABCDGE type electron transport complex subunit G [Rikenellaceae bacterium]